MTDKIIDEVMGLVDELVGESMAGGMCSIATNPDVAKQAPDFAKAITTLKSSIRAKLREVLERKPISKEKFERMESAAYAATRGKGKTTFEYAENLKNRIEKYHHIGAE